MPLLDHLEPDRARYLAAFAYLLGSVAHRRYQPGLSREKLIPRE